MKKIAIIVGSKSDLKQCQIGLKFLEMQIKESFRPKEIQIYVRSQHRNTLDLQKLLYSLVESGVDVAIVGAGWANHLTGCVDAFLRYQIKTTKLTVIGVAFEDKENEVHTKAAILSMTEVPGTQAILKDPYGDYVFVGEHGFLRACELAVTTANFPEIKISEPKPPLDLTLEEAIKLASE